MRRHEVGKPPGEVAPILDLEAEVIEAGGAVDAWGLRVAGEMKKVFAAGAEGGELRRLAVDAQADAIAVEGDEAGKVARREVDNAEAGGVVDDGGVAGEGGGVCGHGCLHVGVTG
jgi:hypothetical protein